MPEQYTLPAYLSTEEAAKLGLHTTFVQKLSLTYYTHNLPFAQRHLAQPAGQPAIVHHR
jgi:hypothetical protein